jgi:hypothetical protein
MSNPILEPRITRIARIGNAGNSVGLVWLGLTSATVLADTELTQRFSISVIRGL